MKQTTNKFESVFDMIQVRIDTIIDDPSSADDFENIESLTNLENKIKRNYLNFSEKEKKWLKEEIRNREQWHLEKLLGINDPIKVENELVRESSIKTIWSEVGSKNGVEYSHAQEFKYNDGGRAKAGYKGDTGDCVARAVAIASGKPYQEIYDILANGNAKQKVTKHTKKHLARVKTASYGISVRRKWFQEYMKLLGFKWVPTMLIGQGCKVHLRGDELPKGTLVISVSKHYTTMIDGVLMDTYDCSRNGTRCVYGYFIKQ